MVEGIKFILVFNPLPWTLDWLPVCAVSYRAQLCLLDSFARYAEEEDRKHTYLKTVNWILSSLKINIPIICWSYMLWSFLHLHISGRRGRNTCKSIQLLLSNIKRKKTQTHKGKNTENITQCEISSLHGPRRTGSLFCSSQLQCKHHPGSISFPALLSNSTPHYLNWFKGGKLIQKPLKKAQTR